MNEPRSLFGLQTAPPIRRVELSEFEYNTALEEGRGRVHRQREKGRGCNHKMQENGPVLSDRILMGVTSEMAFSVLTGLALTAYGPEGKKHLDVGHVWEVRATTQFKDDQPGWEPTLIVRTTDPLVIPGHGRTFGVLMRPTASMRYCEPGHSRLAPNLRFWDCYGHRAVDETVEHDEWFGTKGNPEREPCWWVPTEHLSDIKDYIKV